MNKSILGYDCDGTELYELDIVRAVWYTEIDFDIETDVDPRQYCVVKASNNKPYLISVYDHWNKQEINRFEGRELDAEVPVKIRPIEEAVNYERAVTCDNEILNYEFGREELVKTLDKKLR